MNLSDVPWQVLAIAGAAVAGGTGGLNGLEHFAAGFAGALVGYSLAGMIQNARNPVQEASNYTSDPSGRDFDSPNYVRIMEKIQLPSPEEMLQWRSQDEIWRADNPFSDFTSGSALPGILNSGRTVFDLYLNSSIDITLFNVDIQPTNVVIKMNLPFSQSVGSWLAPMGSQNFHFAVFGDFPIEWQFDITAYSIFRSRAGFSASVFYKIESY